jgi:hypothetical protein
MRPRFALTPVLRVPVTPASVMPPSLMVGLVVQVVVVHRPVPLMVIDVGTPVLE